MIIREFSHGPTQMTLTWYPEASVYEYKRVDAGTTIEKKQIFQEKGALRLYSSKLRMFKRKVMRLENTISKREALELSYKLWSKLPKDTEEKGRILRTLSLDTFVNGCPLCQYAGEVTFGKEYHDSAFSLICKNCPAPELNCYLGDLFHDWVDLGNEGSFKESKEKAGGIAAIIKAALDEFIEKEEKENGG